MTYEYTNQLMLDRPNHTVAFVEERNCLPETWEKCVAEAAAQGRKPKRVRVLPYARPVAKT